MIKKTTAVLILNSKGEYLLLHRSAAAEHHAGMWESVGGHLEDDESFEQAACREVFEEVGIEIQPNELELIYKKMFDDDERPNQYDVRIFSTTTHQQPVLKEPETFQQLRWVAKADIAGLDLAPYAANDFRELGVID